jgi:hypothetical protein
MRAVWRDDGWAESRSPILDAKARQGWGTHIRGVRAKMQVLRRAQDDKF